MKHCSPVTSSLCCFFIVYVLCINSLHLMCYVLPLVMYQYEIDQQRREEGGGEERMYVCVKQEEK